MQSFYKSYIYLLLSVLLVSCIETNETSKVWQEQLRNANDFVKEENAKKILRYKEFIIDPLVKKTKSFDSVKLYKYLQVQEYIKAQSDSFLQINSNSQKQLLEKYNEIIGKYDSILKDTSIFISKDIELPNTIVTLNNNSEQVSMYNNILCAENFLLEQIQLRSYYYVGACLSEEFKIIAPNLNNYDIAFTSDNLNDWVNIKIDGIYKNGNKIDVDYDINPKQVFASLHLKSDLPEGTYTIKWQCTLQQSGFEQVYKMTDTFIRYSNK